MSNSRTFRQKIAHLSAFACALSASWPAFASTESTLHHGTLRITWAGNQRTSNSFLKRIIGVCLEQQKVDEAVVQETFQQCLLNSRLFAEASIVQNGHDLFVHFEEKWTLIPIPILLFGSGQERKAGFFLVESNFLGVGMTLVAGGTISNRGSSFIGILNNPSLFLSNWNTMASVDRQITRVKLIESERIVTDGFEERTAGASIGLGYRQHQMGMNSTTTFRRREYSKMDSFTKPDEVQTLRTALHIFIDQSNFKLYFAEGFVARINAATELMRSDSARPIQMIDGQIGWQSTALQESQALQLWTSFGRVQGGSKNDVPRVGASRGFRGIEATTAWVEGYQVAALDNQIPLNTSTTGTWTIAPFFDLGHLQIRGGSGKSTSYFATGIGSYFFFRGIALPGLGFTLGYNHRYQKSFFAVSVGITL